MIQLWKTKISRRTHDREIYSKIVLPPVISEDIDFDVIKYYTPRPNFITNKKVETMAVKLNNCEKIPEIENKIVSRIGDDDVRYPCVLSPGNAG